MYGVAPVASRVLALMWQYVYTVRRECNTGALFSRKKEYVKFHFTTCALLMYGRTSCSWRTLRVVMLLQGWCMTELTNPIRPIPLETRRLGAS